MPAHSVLISPAQGLPACCATAAEPDSSSAVNITSPDRIPVILGSSVKLRKGGSGSIRKPAAAPERLRWDAISGEDGAKRNAQRWPVLRIAFPLGSKAPFLKSADDFLSTPMNRQCLAACLKGATSGLMRHNKIGAALDCFFRRATHGAAPL